LQNTFRLISPVIAVILLRRPQEIEGKTGIPGNNRGMEEKRLKRTPWQSEQRKSCIVEENNCRKRKL
jgi:hypothetical protein